MSVGAASTFTIGVFPDVPWARRGIDALLKAGIDPASLSIIGLESDEVTRLIATIAGSPGSQPERLMLRDLGPLLASGPLLGALRSEAGSLERLGLGRALKGVGFQSHDGRIYERLTARGGVLVAIHSEPRAADALAVLLSYGGGNAAIGAWTGRL